MRRKLGVGATGTVYLAEHSPTGARFAVKVLHPHLASLPMVRACFYAEARAVSRIVHRNVARVLDARPGPGGQPCLLMEYVAGEPLSCLALPLTPGEAVEVLEQALEGLEAAHAQGVVHRDLRPDNLFLTRGKGGERRVKLLDLGMSKVLAACLSSEGLASRVVVGAPAYMAPEQWQGAAVDGRTDVYALGVVGYQLLTGRLPFGSGRMGEVLLGQKELRPAWPQTHNARVPPALSGVLMRALARRPEDRFPDARAFRLALTEALRHAQRELAPVEAAAPRAGAPAGLQVRAGGLGRPDMQPVRASEVTAEGLFIAFDGPPPPLAARLPLEFSFQGQRLSCVGDVVRHVSVDEARAWGVAAGFFVHLAEPPAGLRQLMAQLQQSAVEPPPDAELAQLLARTADLGQDPYALLGLPLAAGFEEVRQRSEAALLRLELFRQRSLPAAQRRELEALRARVEAAQRTLGNPLSRVSFDAVRGNAHGIARCMAAGLSEEAIEPVRRAFLTARPGAESRARSLFSQGRTLEAQHALNPALACYAQALALDPLNISWQRHYWTLLRRTRPMTVSLPAVTSSFPAVAP